MTTSGPAMAVRSGRPALRLAASLLAGLAALLFLEPIVWDVPPHMDEYIHFHPIACREFPLARYNDFRSPCGGSRDLLVLGTWLPLRSYNYLGITTSVLYTPLYELFPEPRAVRLLGLLWLALFTWGLVRLTRVRAPWAVALTCLNLPFAFQLIVDTGPVGLHCVLVVWEIIALRWLLLRRRFSLGAAALACLAGLGLFLGLEQKAMFLVLAPGIACLGVLLAWIERGRRTDDERARISLARNALRFVVPMLAVAAALAAILFSAETREHRSYWDVMSEVAVRFDLLDVSGQRAHFTEHLARFVTNLAEFGSRVFVSGDDMGAAWTALYWALLLVVAPLGLIRARDAERPLVLFAVCAALFAGTMWLVNLRALTWGGHHLILAWPFLLIGAGFLFRGLDESGRTRTAVVLLVLLSITQLGVRNAMLARPIHPHTSPDRFPIHDYLDREPRFPRESVIVILDWGSYYLKSLYGPREQLVIYVEPLRGEADLERLERLSLELGRELVFVARSDNRGDLPRVRERFPWLERVPVPGERPDSEWQLWARPG